MRRLSPFPYKKFFAEASPDDPELWWEVLRGGYNAKLLLNRADADGVQLNVRLTGSGWEHPHAEYCPGLLVPGEYTSVSVPYGGWWVEGGADYVGPTLGVVEEPSVLAKYIAHDSRRSDVRRSLQYWPNYVPPADFSPDPLLSAGLRTYPGVASSGFTGWEGTPSLDLDSGSLPANRAVWLNEPIAFEAWFSENTERASPVVGFSGYTGFARSWGNGAPYVHVPTDSVPDAHLRRLVCGVLRTGADLATCGPESVMWGFITTATAEGLLVQACTNGVAGSSFVAPYSDDGSDPQISYSFDTVWGSPAEGVEVWAGQTYASWAEYGSELYCPLSGAFDTFDVKWAWYVDVYSPTHPVGVPVTKVFSNASYTVEEVVAYVGTEYHMPMYTHPAWEVPVSGNFWTNFKGTYEA